MPSRFIRLWHGTRDVWVNADTIASFRPIDTRPPGVQLIYTHGTKEDFLVSTQEILSQLAELDRRETPQL